MPEHRRTCPEEMRRAMASGFDAATGKALERFRGYDQDAVALVRQDAVRAFLALLDRRREEQARLDDEVPATALVVSAGAAIPTVDSDDAIVQWISDDTILVLGNTDLAERLGAPLQRLSPGLARALSDDAARAVQVASNGAQAATAVGALRESAAVYRIAAESMPALHQYGTVMRDGQMLGVLRGDGGGFKHMLRFESAAGTGTNVLKAAGAMSNLVFVGAVIAGQLQMQRTLSVVCAELDDAKQRQREEQISEISVAQQQVMKVVRIALELGELTPGLRAELPDKAALLVHIDRARLEVERAQREFENLPPKARDRVPILERQTGNALMALGLYREAERTLTVVEAVYQHDLAQAHDPALALLERDEETARRGRVEVAVVLAEQVQSAMAAIADEPGSGWLSHKRRARVEAIAAQVQEDLQRLSPDRPRGSVRLHGSPV